jgi:hypothetical protein
VPAFKEAVSQIVGSKNISSRAYSVLYFYFMAKFPFLGTIIGPDGNNLVVSVAVKQGNKSYSARNALGPGLSSSADEDLPLIEFRKDETIPDASAIQVSRSSPTGTSRLILFQPFWDCLPCGLRRIECVPQGVGLECHNCMYKKMGSLCDHSMGSVQLASIVRHFKPVSDLVSPQGKRFETICCWFPF